MKFTLLIFAALVLPLASEAARLNEPEDKKVRDLAEELKDLDWTAPEIADTIRVLEDAGEARPTSSFDCHIWPWACEEDEELPACFSSLSSIKVLNEGHIPMHDLQVGDYILTASGDYKRVYAFGHKNPNITTDFLRIFTDGYLNPLEVSPKHLLYVNNTKGFLVVPAKDIKEGDFLRSTEGRATRIIDIRHVKREGMYAPFTTDGTLVVDGIVASSYVMLGPMEYHPFISKRVHGVSHLAISPIRFMCTKISTRICEWDNSDGVPYVFAFLKGFMEWTVPLWTPLHIIAMDAYLGFAILSRFSEWLISVDGMVVLVCGIGTFLLLRQAQYSDVVIWKTKE